MKRVVLTNRHKRAVRIFHGHGQAIVMLGTLEPGEVYRCDDPAGSDLYWADSSLVEIRDVTLRRQGNLTPQSPGAKLLCDAMEAA